MSVVAESVTLEALDFPLVLRALTAQVQTPMGRKRLEGTVSIPHPIP